jgi:hypothetical protein
MRETVFTSKLLYYKQGSFNFFVRSKCASKGVAQGSVAWRNFPSSYCDSVTHWDCFSTHCYEVRVHGLVNLKKIVTQLVGVLLYKFKFPL